MISHLVSIQVLMYMTRKYEERLLADPGVDEVDVQLTRTPTGIGLAHAWRTESARPRAARGADRREHSGLYEFTPLHLVSFTLRYSRRFLCDLVNMAMLKLVRYMTYFKHDDFLGPVHEVPKLLRHTAPLFPDKVRKAGEGRLDSDAGGTGESLAVVREPVPGGESDFATLCALLDLWRNDHEVAHGELILDRRVAVTGERILHRPQHRLAALRAFVREREKTRRELLPKIHRRLDERKMLLVKHAPRSDGELHHGR